MRVYFIRHGETNLNKYKTLQGQSDTELNDYGRELAHITAKALEDVAFDIAFTSPLKRAKETAQIVLGDREVQLIEEKRIQEIGFGEFEGLCYGKENYNIPDKTFLNFFNAPECYVTAPQGESFLDVIKRTGEFWEELICRKEYADKNILVSTHGCALKAILANIKKTPLEKFWGSGVHKNCAVTIVDIVEEQVEVVEEGKVFY